MIKRLGFAVVMGAAALVACEPSNVDPKSPNGEVTNNSGGMQSPAIQAPNSQTQLPTRGNGDQGTFSNGTRMPTNDGTSTPQTSGVNGTGTNNMGGSGSTTMGGSGNNGTSNTGGGAGRKVPDNGPINAKDGGAM